MQRFKNQVEPDRTGFRDIADWLRTRRSARWPDHVPLTGYPPPPRHDGLGVAATFIGHSTFLLQAGGLSFLTDPIFSKRASPFSFAGPKRVRPPGHRPEALPGVDVVLVSHCHYDHMDLPSLRALQSRFGPAVASGLRNGRHLGRAGIAEPIELGWYDSANVKGARITYVPARHFSARWLHDRNVCLWGGFVIEAGGAVICFVGDTAWGPHFAEIAERFPRIDLTLMPIGAYEPRWFMRNYHIDPDEAVRAHLALRSRRTIGMHFGTFKLTEEAIDDPVRRLDLARRRHGIDERDFFVLDAGETRVLSPATA